LADDKSARVQGAMRPPVIGHTGKLISLYVLNLTELLKMRVKAFPVLHGHRPRVYPIERLLSERRFTPTT